MKTDNELIAEFDTAHMVWYTPKNTKYEPYWRRMKNSMPYECRVENMKYDTSWDWLMPVVEKINNVLHDLQRSRPPHTACHGDLIEVDIHCALHEVNIGMVYKAVVEFIKWYNEQQK